MKRLIFSLFVFIYCSGQAQDQNKVDSLLERSKNAEGDSLKATALLSLSSQYQSNDLYKSLEYAKEALKSAEAAESPQLEARTNNKIGIILFHFGQYDGSLDYFIRSRKIYENIADSSKLIGQINNICNVYLAMEEYDKAWELYNFVIDEQEKLLARGDSTNLSQLHVFYSSMGNISEKRGELENAQYYFKIALENALEHDFKISLASLYNSLGNNALQLGQMDSAVYYINNSISVCKELHNKVQLAEAYIYLANYYAKLNNHSQALVMADTAYAIAKEVSVLEYMQDAAFVQYNASTALGNFKEALDAHIRYQQYHDSLFNEQAIKETTRLQMRYEFDKREELNKAAQNRMQLIYSIIIMVLIFGIIITGLLYWLTKSRTQSAFFAQKSLEKDLELRQRELVMKEIYLLEKNETMKGAINQLSDLKLNADSNVENALGQVIKEVETSINKTLWEEFEVRYQQVHEGFYKKLREEFPNLSTGEEKLAALLRLGMSTKEIADIMHQSVKSVEVARSRLRKKLNLTNTSANLSAFLTEL